MTPTTTPLLEVRDLHVRAGAGATLLEGLSFRLDAGQRIGVIGASGAGKSMLALALMGLLRPPLQVARGGIFFEGHSLLGMPSTQRHALRGTGLFMVFQSAGAWLDPIWRIGHQLLACAARAGIVASSRARACDEALRAVALPSAVAQQHAHELSGGMKQRVLIAMALLLSPRLLIADEPTSGLDDETADEVLAALSAAQQRLGSALIFITHELKRAAAISDRLLVLDTGRLVEDRPTAAFTSAPHSAMGHALWSAARELEPGAA